MTVVVQNGRLDIIRLKIKKTAIFKLLEKIKIRSAFKGADLRGLLENPLFYFGFISLILFGTMYDSCGSMVNLNGLSDSQAVFFNDFFNNSAMADSNDLFCNQNKSLAMETPDLKIIQDDTIGGVATPRVLSTKVLGDTFGSTLTAERKDIIEYIVQSGDTVESIAQTYGISKNTVLWANELSSGSKIKVGQTLVILPVDGVLHLIKSGDTITDIAKKYKTKADDIIAFNSLSNENDIYIGDMLIVPGGTLPAKASPILNVQAPLADNFFMLPTAGRITQGVHFYNAVDTANKCGTPVYAAASGVVQRVKYGYNFGGGNHVTILHAGGIVTYYGHLMTIFVKPGDKVNIGDRIALMGGGTGTAGDGLSTGCHLHFEVIGAKNPLSKYSIGSTVSIK